MTEMITTPVCKAEQQSFFKTLPETIIEDIICLLPTTKEAAMTSILSKEWRYKWTKIPKLEFCLSHVSITEENQVEGEEMDMACKPYYDILQILLLHQGGVHEFNLHLDLDYDFFGLDLIILYLSKNHLVKKLTLYGWNDSYWVNLPTSVFSLHHLTDLKLCYFEIDDQSIFNGFGSLRTLSLHCIGISYKSLVNLLSNCPSLQSLSLVLCLDSISKELPALQYHLKYLYFEQSCFAEDHGLACLLVLIRCSPNLEKIKLEFDWLNRENYSVVWEEYSDVWLEHLSELEIEYFRNLKHEIEFMKFILSRSSNLKKVSIMSNVAWNQKSEMLKALSQVQRSSPVKITYKHVRDSCFKDL